MSCDAAIWSSFRLRVFVHKLPEPSPIWVRTVDLRFAPVPGVLIVIGGLTFGRGKGELVYNYEEEIFEINEAWHVTDANLLGAGFKLYGK